jgi:alkyl hydroperoxide reductase subunit F
VYDVIILGGGPAGLAAAVYLARQRMRFLLLTQNIGGQTLWSSDVENYLGFHLLDGPSLVKRFREHLKDYAASFDLHENEPVTRVSRIIGGFSVATAKGSYTARTVLVATGTKHRTLDVPGEKEFYGHGVTYCANCDAPLFAGKRVMVVGGGNSAMDAALFTAKYAAQVTLTTINPELRGDGGLIKQCLSHPKIKLLTSVKTLAIQGAKSVTGVRLLQADGQERIQSVDGVFIEIGIVPVAQSVDFVAKDQSGQIIVDKSNATDVEGIWAAGDVTDIPSKQIAVAVGEGSKAALSIIAHLQRQPWHEPSFEVLPASDKKVTV